MSRQKIVIVVVIVALIGGALAFILSRPRSTGPSGTSAAALGETSPEAALWARLQRAKAWLPSFEAALSDPQPEAATVLAAFASLADKVGGASGFWRDTVPNELLTCHKEPEQAVCKKLQEALPELTAGEALMRSIGRLDETRAALFLSRNAEAMLAWVEMFAPSEPSAAAMRLTSFWEQKLAPAIAGQ